VLVHHFPLEIAAIFSWIVGVAGTNRLPVVPGSDVAGAMAGLSTCLASKADPSLASAPVTANEYLDELERGH